MAERFVILLHRGHGPDHYDLMLSPAPEAPRLLTWQFADPPWEARGDASAAGRRIQDHRAAYLDYEGPVSRGRGTVERVDEGTWEPVEQSERRRVIDFAGRRLRGRYELARGDAEEGLRTLRPLEVTGRRG